MRCSEEVKQKGAVQRLRLGSRLQQEIVLQNSLKTIKTKIQLMMKRTDMSFIHDAWGPCLFLFFFLKEMFLFLPTRAASSSEARPATTRMLATLRV